MLLHVKRLIVVIVVGFVFVAALMSGATGKPKLLTGPTAENALAADKELAKALQNNDTTGIYRMLDKDWAVVTTHGGVYEGPGVFPSGIRTGYRTLQLMELTEPRVRMFGDVALVTTKVKMTSTLAGKHYDNIKERQTDVLRWENGKWKCILTQESDLVE